jgi:alanine racemase
LGHVRPAWAEIDLDALAHNVGEARRLVGPGVLICAAVKANAYGHGAAITARALLESGADRLSVATLDEGIELRRSGVAAPILIMGAMERRRADQIVREGLTQAVSSFDEALLLSGEALRQQGASCACSAGDVAIGARNESGAGNGVSNAGDAIIGACGEGGAGSGISNASSVRDAGGTGVARSAADVRGWRAAKAHIKIDTGMGRMGYVCVGGRDEEAGAVRDIIAASKLPGLEIEGIFTHFAAADEPDARDELDESGKSVGTFTDGQLRHFMRICGALSEKGLNIPIRHCANSAAIVGCPRSHLDMVRPGIMLYAMPRQLGREPAFRQVMSLKARIVFMKRVGRGFSVGYGRAHTASGDAVIATLPIGYADGLDRRLSCGLGYALVCGARAPIVGRICMDQCMIDVTGIGDARLGSEAVLFGGRLDAGSTAPGSAGFESVSLGLTGHESSGLGSQALGSTDSGSNGAELPGLGQPADAGSDCAMPERAISACGGADCASADCGAADRSATGQGAADRAASWGGVAIPLDELSEKLGAINYELTCAVGRRVPRVYIKSGAVAGCENYIWPRRQK